MKKKPITYKNLNLDKISKRTLFISGVIILFSFIAPLIFTQESPFGINLNDKGGIGDTIGGLMNPFIALAGVFITFLAFYIQFQANNQQRSQFRIELNEQKKQFEKNQFENQFYEMVRLHKENVNEISITLKTSYFSGQETIRNENQISGREVFKYFLNEIKILYSIAKNTYLEENPDLWINKAYGIFFHGTNFEIEHNPSTVLNKNDRTFVEALLEFSKIKTKTDFSNLMLKYKLKIDWLNYSLFIGHSALLAHYYRHLYQTVKFVANQNETFISYEEKRNYLRILRAQLSNQEQAMLFYNWKSEFGGNWENNLNHFFTDYRIIHNIYNELIIDDFDLYEIFRLNEQQYYRKERGRDTDYLFEFQDWN